MPERAQPHLFADARRPQSNLPPDLTNFVGRERELSELVDLSNRSRLITLAGPPGVGKTRLALQLAGRIADQYRDGVWLVEFAAVSDEGMVATAVMRALGLGARQGRGSAEVVSDWLTGREALFVFDNCEHLLQSVAEFTEELITDCHGIRVITTSRERLRIGAEATWRVEPLPEGDATRLFVERAEAHSVQPLAAAPEIARICRRLDHLPLAIELAAARAGILSLEAIEDRIGDRFRLLTAGTRTGPARQHTLGAALQWSYDLLSLHEQLVFQRLAVFVGSFDLAAAEAVCSDSRIDRTGVTDSVIGLVEKSLVVARGSRYQMLETVREFARNRLREAGETEPVRLHHGRYYAELVAGIEVDRATAKEPGWLNRFEADRENFRAALDWSFAQEPDTAAVLLVALSLPWYVHGEIREATEWFNRGLNLPIGDPSLRTRVLVEAGHFAHLAGDLVTARARYETGLMDARRDAEPDVLARCLELFGALNYQSGNLDVAREQLGESLGIYESLAWPASAGSLNLRLGAVAASEEDLAKARSFYERGVALCRGSSDRVLAVGLALLGAVALAQRDVHLAREAAVESSQLALRCGERRGACYCLGLSAAIAAEASSFTRALTLYAASETLAARIGIELEPDWERFIVAAVEPARAALLASAVQAAVANGSLLGFEEALLMASEAHKQEENAVTLSRRELEVAALVAEGLTARQIATRLFIAERTAESHVERIRGKLGVRSRGQIATWFVQRRWLQI